MKVNLSLNGVPGTLWEIKRQEQIHWYLGYRQAILIVGSLDKALREAELSRKRTLLEINKKKQEITGKHNNLVNSSISDPTEALTLEILKLEIEMAENGLVEQEQMVLDAGTERETALIEKTRIELEHPEIADGEYQSLQKQYASVAFQCKLARAVTIAAYASHKMLPEGAAEVIYDMRCFSEQEQKRFSEKVMVEILELIPELLPDTFKQEVLTEALNNTGVEDGLVFRGN